MAFQSTKKEIRKNLSLNDEQRQPQSKTSASWATVRKGLRDSRLTLTRKERTKKREVVEPVEELLLCREAEEGGNAKGDRDLDETESFHDTRSGRQQHSVDPSNDKITDSSTLRNRSIDFKDKATEFSQTHFPESSSSGSNCFARTPSSSGSRSYAHSPVSSSFPTWFPGSTRGPYEAEITSQEAIKIFRDRTLSRRLQTTSVPLSWFHLAESQFKRRFQGTEKFYETHLRQDSIMNDTWLKVGSPKTSLAIVEQAFSHPNLQSGMIATEIALMEAKTAAVEPANRKASVFPCKAPTQNSVASIAETINLHLIRSCAFLACGEVERGLESADRGFSIANQEMIYYMMSKSQLYRGMCLMALERWKEASDAFTRAANVRGWAGKVASLKALAETNLLEEMSRKRRRV